MPCLLLSPTPHSTTRCPMALTWRCTSRRRSPSGWTHWSTSYFHSFRPTTSSKCCSLSWVASDPDSDPIYPYTYFPIPDTTGWGSEVCIKDNNTGPESNANSQKQRQLQKFVPWSLNSKKRDEAERSMWPKGKTNEKKLCEKLTFSSVPTPRATRIVLRPPKMQLFLRKETAREGYTRANEREGRKGAYQRVDFEGPGSWYKRAVLRRAEYHSRFRHRAGNNQAERENF